VVLQNDKTAAVLVERRDPHPLYKRLMLKSRK
jgi:ribosomal protein S17